MSRRSTVVSLTSRARGFQHKFLFVFNVIQNLLLGVLLGILRNIVGPLLNSILHQLQNIVDKSQALHRPSFGFHHSAVTTRNEFRVRKRHHPQYIAWLSIWHLTKLRASKRQCQCLLSCKTTQNILDDAKICQIGRSQTPRHVIDGSEHAITPLGAKILTIS